VKQANIYMTPSRQEKKISRSEVFLLPRFILRNDARPGCPLSVLVPMRVQNVSAPNTYRGSIAEPSFDSSAP
jgi:hypothetical protein